MRDKKGSNKKYKIYIINNFLNETSVIILDIYDPCRYLISLKVIKRRKEKEKEWCGEGDKKKTVRCVYVRVCSR